MLIEFDPAKDAINRVKHGVSFAEAAAFDLDRALVVPDERFDYGEERFLAYDLVGGRLHVMTFTMRGQVVRVIGLRRANARERRRYEQET